MKVQRKIYSPAPIKILRLVRVQLLNGSGAVVKEITDILFSFVTDDGLISEKQSPPTDPRVIEYKNRWFMVQSPSKGSDGSEKTQAAQTVDSANGWKCPECGQEENQGKFCCNCGMPRP